MPKAIMINPSDAASDVIDIGTLLNGYVNQNGEFASASWYNCTDFIEIDNSFVSIVICNSTSSSSNIRCFCFYNENKSFISGSGQNVDVGVDIAYTIPTNAKYIRFNISSNNVDVVACKYGNKR